MLPYENINKKYSWYEPIFSDSHIAMQVPNFETYIIKYTQNPQLSEKIVDLLREINSSVFHDYRQFFKRKTAQGAGADYTAVD